MTADNTTNIKQDTLQLASFFPYRLSQLQSAVSHSISEQYGKHDLSRQQWRILAVLGDHEISGTKQSLSAKQLGEQTNLDKMQTSRAIEKLCQQNRATKTTDENDKRSILIKLTDEGQALYQQIVPDVKEKNDQLLSALTQRQQEQLITMMDKLLKQAQS